MSKQRNKRKIKMNDSRLAITKCRPIKIKLCGIVNHYQKSIRLGAQWLSFLASRDVHKSTKGQWRHWGHSNWIIIRQVRPGILLTKSVSHFQACTASKNQSCCWFWTMVNPFKSNSEMIATSTWETRYDWSWGSNTDKVQWECPPQMKERGRG